MEGAAWQSQATVDAGVGIGRYTGHVDPLHKGQGAATAAVEEHVIHPAPLLHQHPFVDQHRKAQLPFVEAAGGGEIAAGEAEMVDGHRLGSRWRHPESRPMAQFWMSVDRGMRLGARGSDRVVTRLQPQRHHLHQTGSSVRLWIITRAST